MRRIQLIEECKSGAPLHVLPDGEKAMAFDAVVDMHLGPRGGSAHGMAGVQSALAGCLGVELAREAANLMEQRLKRTHAHSPERDSGLNPEATEVATTSGTDTRREGLFEE